MLTFNINKISWALVVLLLSCMFTLEVTSALQENQTIDEGTHLASGYSYLMRNDFRLNREHPPLLKELAALPLVLINHRLASPFDTREWAAGDQWGFAQTFLYENDLSAETMLLIGRLPTMLLSLLLGFFIFRWSKELFGIWPALFSLTFYAFSPTILAHSRYVTTDIGMATLFFITIYYFYKYLKQGQQKFLWATALFFAFAQAAKFSNVILLPILIVLYILAIRYKNQLSTRLFSTKKFFIGALLLMVVTFVVLLAVYGFRFTKPLDDTHIQQLYRDQAYTIDNNFTDQLSPLVQSVISITNPAHFTGRLLKNTLANVPLPLVEYVDGFIQLYTHNYYGHTSYLRGEHSEFGWWYYFPYAFAVKTPVITQLLLLLLLLTGVGWVWKRYRGGKSTSAMSIEYYFLLVPPLLYMLISLTSSLNLGVRHIIVVYPFIFVLVGYVAKKVVTLRRHLLTTILICSLTLYVVSSALIYPHYLAYFNELAGGPENGPRHLVDSNIDWGQDILHLKQYMSDHQIPYVCMVYFGQAKLSYFGIDYRYLPDNEHFTSTQDINCVVAISVTALLSKKGEYKWLQEYQPDEKIGYSIYLYDFRTR